MLARPLPSLTSSLQDDRDHVGIPKLEPHQPLVTEIGLVAGHDLVLLFVTTIKGLI